MGDAVGLSEGLDQEFGFCWSEGKPSHVYFGERDRRQAVNEKKDDSESVNGNWFFLLLFFGQERDPLSFGIVDLLLLGTRIPVLSDPC